MRGSGSINTMTAVAFLTFILGCLIALVMAIGPWSLVAIAAVIGFEIKRGKS